MAIRELIAAHHATPKPFTWTKSADEILRRRADGGGSEETLWKGTEHTHVNDWTPDGRSLLISGVSDEIYVQDFPQLASRWQISQNGGLNPLWTTDARALYYRRGATLYRVPVEQVGMALKFGIATQIYTALPAVKGDHRAFGVFPNGDALVLKGASGDRTDHLNLFEHWTVHGLGTRD